MSTASSITGIVPGVMAAGLLAHNVGELEFGLDTKKRSKKNGNHIKRITKLGVTNLIAIPLIGATAQQVNLIP